MRPPTIGQFRLSLRIKRRASHVEKRSPSTLAATSCRPPVSATKPVDPSSLIAIRPLSYWTNLPRLTASATVVPPDFCFTGKSC